MCRKKNSSVKLSDPIGEFFEAVNIFEYKSPEDGLTIDDENIKTNARTVMRICLNINRGLEKTIKEDEAMHDVIQDIFKTEFDAARKKGIQEGLNDANERVAKDMLKKDLPLTLIEEISRLRPCAILAQNKFSKEGSKQC